MSFKMFAKMLYSLHLQCSQSVRITGKRPTIILLCVLFHTLIFFSVEFCFVSTLNLLICGANLQKSQMPVNGHFYHEHLTKARKHYISLCFVIGTNNKKTFFFCNVTVIDLDNDKYSMTPCIQCSIMESVSIIDCNERCSR